MPSYASFAVLLVPTGAAALVFSVANNSFVQLGVDPQMRGRVMALYFMCFMGGTPVGAPLIGWISEHLGPALGADPGRRGLRRGRARRRGRPGPRPARPARGRARPAPAPAARGSPPRVGGHAPSCVRPRKSSRSGRRASSPSAEHGPPGVPSRHPLDGSGRRHGRLDSCRSAGDARLCSPPCSPGTGPLLRWI